MVGKNQKGLALALALLLCATCLSAQNKKSGQTDSLVRLQNAKSLELIDKNGQTFRKAIEATFLHNGTYLISDTALWNVDQNTINCWGHVKLMQEETELTSDKLDYMIDDDLAQFRGTVVQLRNRKDNILRTRNLDYNTRDSIALFRDGAAMRDKDGQIIESREGTYDSKKELFTFRDQVNMYTDSIFVKTSLLEYDSGRNKARFLTYIDFWKDGNMLSAGCGWYDRNVETFFFKDKVHGLSENQETWSDSLFFYRVPQDVLLLGNAQIQDTSRHVAGLAQRIFYQDTLAKVRMTREAAVALRTNQDGKIDTLYAGADSLIYWTVKMCDIPEDEIKASATRLEEMTTDPVTEYRRQAAKAAAEAAAKAAEEALKNDPNKAGAAAAAKKAKGAAEATPAAINKPGAPAAAAQAPSDTVPAGRDSLQAGADSLITGADSLLAGADSLLAGADSLKVGADSLAVEKDTTKVGFMRAVGHVKLFRKDMQAKCDSLRYCDLDSIARFYKDPVVWNDGNRQYTADSLAVLVRDGGMDRASLMSNAFIITQEDSLLFDQIKSTEVMAYFDDDSQLERFDALGGATAMFFLQENDTFATVNKVESKMLSAHMKEGQLDRVYYFDSPKNDAYPVAQMPEQEQRMKGFNWQPENQPQGKDDITSLTLKPTERDKYEARPHAKFKQTDIYFPGYMASVYAGIDSVKVMRSRARDEAKRKESMAADSTMTMVSDPGHAPSDSLGTPSDSISASLSDSLSVSDTLNLSDSLAVTDSLAVSDTLKVLSDRDRKLAERKARQDAAELAHQMRIARRDAKWAELDKRDAEKAAAKAEKKLEKKRNRTRKALKFKQKEESSDARKLQKYIERYEKQKARKDEREQEPEPSGERTQGIEARGELSPVAES